MENISQKGTKMSDHMNTRHYIENIPELGEFNNLLNRSTLSQEDKTLMYMHYVEDKDFRYIGDMFGYSESWVKKKHRKIIKKLGKLIE